MSSAYATTLGLRYDSPRPTSDKEPLGITKSANHSLTLVNYAWITPQKYRLYWKPNTRLSNTFLYFRGRTVLSFDDVENVRLVSVNGVVPLPPLAPWPTGGNYTEKDLPRAANNGPPSGETCSSPSYTSHRFTDWNNNGDRRDPCRITVTSK